MTSPTIHQHLDRLVAAKRLCRELSATGGFVDAMALADLLVNGESLVVAMKLALDSLWDFEQKRIPLRPGFFVSCVEFQELARRVGPIPGPLSRGRLEDLRRLLELTADMYQEIDLSLPETAKPICSLFWRAIHHTVDMEAGRVDCLSDGLL